MVIWLLAALVSFVPISLGLHRPDQPLMFEDKSNGMEYPICALELTPMYAVVSSCISFYVPCIIMIGIYCRWVFGLRQTVFLYISVVSIKIYWNRFFNVSCYICVNRFSLSASDRLYCYAQKHVRSIRAVTKVDENSNGKPYRSIRRVKQPKKSIIKYNQSSAYNASDHKAAITVGVIMGVFLLSWVPFFCVNIVASFCKTCIDDRTFKILSWLGYSNSAFNPIIYSIFNKEFRNAFKRILRSRRLCCCCKPPEYLNSHSNDKYITNYDGRHILNSTTDVEMLSAI